MRYKIEKKKKAKRAPGDGDDRSSNAEVTDGVEEMFSSWLTLSTPHFLNAD